MLACVVMAVMLGCGGGGSENSTAPQWPTPLSIFPDFDQVRSDYLSPTEGLQSDPLKIASPACVNQPPVFWQDWLCRQGQMMPIVYQQTNSFNRAIDPYHSWIIVMNNEFIQLLTCNTGPPNQSLGPNDYPFNLLAIKDFIRLELTHDTRPFCGMIPYMAAAYLRGVQSGDYKKELLSWDETVGKKIELTVGLTRNSDEYVWFHVLTHFKNHVTGQRYFVNKSYVMADTIPDSRVNWNWPYRSSFQYPGAIIGLPARQPPQSLQIGGHVIEFDITQQALTLFPEFAITKPGFLGIEISIELGPVINSTSATIRGVRLK